MKTKIQRIANHFGITPQLEKTLEELQELSRAIKFSDFENLIEEIADVEIMLEQIKYLYNVGDKVEEVKEFKINRTIERYNII